MTEYRYIFGSLRSERIIADIPLFGTYMDLELNVGGRFDGSFNLDMDGYNNRTLLDATLPGRTWVCCERNGKPIWIGYVWSRTYQSQSKSMQLYAQSFEYLPSHQLIETSWNRVDRQLNLFNDLWAELQSIPERNMNITLPTPIPVIDVYNQITVEPTDFKFYDEIMSGMADSATGFDWTIDVAKSGMGYAKTLRYGYPVLGNPDPSRLTFEYPGSVLNYYATESMADAGTNVFTLGSGEGTSMIFSEVIHQDLLDSGSPRWDVTSSRKDISDQVTLNGFAQQEAVIRRPPMMIIKPTMKAQKSPAFGEFGLGDACNLVIRDARFPEGFTFPTRIIKWTLNPQSADNSDEYNVVFAGDENG